MMKVTFSTDWHIADKGPASRKDDYRVAVFNKLEQIKTICSKMNVSLNICGGDVFDVKTPKGNTHSLVRETIELISSYPCPTKVVVGNHDIYGDNHDTLERQPLGVVLASGAMTILDDFTLVDHDLKVRIVGLKYGFCELEHFKQIKRGDEDILMVVVHTYASENGGEFYGSEVLKYSDLSHFPIDIFAFGHWHIDQGVKTINGKQFVNVGSLTRGSLGEDNLSRSPKCVLLSFEKTAGKVDTKINQIRLKISPSTEIFDLEAKARVEAERDEIEEFLVRLKSETGSQQNAAKGIEDQISTYDLTKEVRAVVDEYLERARVEIESR